MDDGPHIEGGNEAAQPTSKVVRLPRDWLGPHEELVPFGRRTMPPAVEDVGPEPWGPPPNAEDFWGERSAAVHGVVQAPAPGGPTSGADPGPGTESAERTPRFGLGRRRLVAASVLALVAATAAVVVLSGGAVHQIAGGARLNLAAILSGGVSRSLTIGPPRIVSTTGPSGTHAGQARRPSHRKAVTEPVSHAIRHQSSALAPAPTYAARATSASVDPTYRSNVSVDSSRADTGPPPSSGPSASPTGESGALGPVQSPNG